MEININQLTFGPQSGMVLPGKTAHTTDPFSGPGEAFLRFSPSQIFQIP
jgi:hypothetical protein